MLPVITVPTAVLRNLKRPCQDSIWINTDISFETFPLLNTMKRTISALKTEFDMALLIFKLQIVTSGCLYFSFDTPPCVWFIAGFLRGGTCVLRSS